VTTAASARRAQVAGPGHRGGNDMRSMGHLEGTCGRHTEFAGRSSALHLPLV